jgi:hypothetical protein
VNAVLATDIANKELQTSRRHRWDAAFNADNNEIPIDNDALMSRKATIVFEYVIQVSDVSHCMQHWLTYQKINARLLEERYIAWVNGMNAGKNPALGWYNGEIWFFDNYIILLAKKLFECGVFGVSYQEYLAYAQESRVEWEHKGESIVAELVSYGTVNKSMGRQRHKEVILKRIVIQRSSLKLRHSPA